MYIYYSNTTFTFGYNLSGNSSSFTADTGIRYLVIDIAAGGEL